MKIPDSVTNHVKTKYSSTLEKDLSTGKYSHVLLFVDSSNKKLILKSNSKQFPVLSELDFLKRFENTPAVIDYSIEENWILMDFIEGDLYDRNDPDVGRDEYVRLGKCFRDLHSNSSEKYLVYDKKGQKKSYDSYPKLLNSILSKMILDAKFSKFIRFVTDDIDFILNEIKTYKSDFAVLTHGDGHLGNALFTDSKVILINPSTERYMDFWWDLSMFRWQVENNLKSNEYINAFSEGYGKNIELETKERYLSDLVVYIYMEYVNYKEGGSTPRRLPSLNENLMVLRNIKLD